MDRPASITSPRHRLVVVALAGMVGLGLMAHAATVSSATYDEVDYLRIAADWWRTGRDDEMTRMGSPVTFFKLQTGPVFAMLDLTGHGALIDHAVAEQARLLPIVRVGSLWIWLVAFGVTAAWAGALYGPDAMAFAAVLFAASPNLLAHGTLATMESPIVAATVGMCYLFWRFLDGGRRADFAASALVGGLAFSCKFTTILVPPILAVAWFLDGLAAGGRTWPKVAARVGCGMLAYGAILVGGNLLVTGFETLPLSPRTGDHPSLPAALAAIVERRWPIDWVGFATQVLHQRHGGPSYLLGERRLSGWWHYYPIALGVKVPIAALTLFAARCLVARRERPVRRDWALPVAIGLFLLAAMAGSKRNYGVRYLLPVAPLAVAWISKIGATGRGWRRFGWLCLVGQGFALASIHPHELSYFNAIGGGPIGGRRILADSNLDWGQGLRSLARLERGQFPDLTLYYFGSTDPARYGVHARSFLITANAVPTDLPPELAAETRYVAVSASLQHGPWGPEGYFDRLDHLNPVAYTDDATIAVYDLGPRRQ